MATLATYFYTTAEYNLKLQQEYNLKPQQEYNLKLYTTVEYNLKLQQASNYSKRIFDGHESKSLTIPSAAASQESPLRVKP